jgi:Fungal specific transcription factor domain
VFPPQQNPSPELQFHDLSIVNYLHSSDYSTTLSTTASPSLSDSEIEKECLRLCFQNLHLIDPILDEIAFSARCEKEVWTNSKSPADKVAVKPSFMALFNAVLAVGAITAGVNASFMSRHTWSNPLAQSSNLPAYPPLKLAKLFFERSKASLGDPFKSCSLESMQTLFLLAVFCQNALKPHSCYLYSGMAVRTALALGLLSRK